MGSVLGCLAGEAVCCAGNCLCSILGKSCACCGLRQSNATRITYAVFFLLTTALAWMTNEAWFADAIGKVPNASERYPCAPDASGSTHACYANLSVMRVSLALCLYHSFLAVCTFGVTSSKDVRAGLHNGMWLVKGLLWVGAIVGCFFIPAQSIMEYGIAAMVGAFLFILIQLLLLIELAHVWNESWIGNYQDTDNKRWLVGVAVAMVLFFLTAFVLTVILYVYFAGSPSCKLNIFFVTFNLILALIASFLAILPKVQDANPRSGLLQAAVVTLYATVLVWSALSSAPHDSEATCSGGDQMPDESKAQTVGVVFGVLFSFVSIIYSAVSTATSPDVLTGTGGASASAGLTPSSGSEDRALLDKAESGRGADSDEDATTHEGDDEADGCTYNYAYFHLILALAAMYVGATISSWQVLEHSDDGFIVTEHLAAVWVRVIASWLAVLLYIWTLVAPLILTDREFS